MRKIIAAALMSVLLAGCTPAGIKGDGTASSLPADDPDYDMFFTGERLRLDFILTGNDREQDAYLDGLHRECAWAGSPRSLIDRFGYGQYFFEAFAGDTLVYSHGFSTLFEEWRTTEEARRRDMAQSQTVWMPFPKKPVNVVLYQRIRATGLFEKMFETVIDPSDRHIVPGPENDFKVRALQESGDPATKVDLVFSGEGYTRLEMPKLRRDARRMMEYLFSMEPYAGRRDDFNVWLVESWSEDSGVDIPQDGDWKSTVMDSGFDTFYEDRYLTVQDHRKIASVYSGAPFDAVFIIANESKYGGGGIYNSYAMGSSDHRLSDPVFIHEFGHSFAGLGDEYYDSSVAYDDEYYPAGIEPWEPNITNMTDFESKWADMVAESTPVPTPNDPDVWYGTVGVFEGAGYMVHGCYRPYYECRMLNNTAPCFCPVCQRAISRMIDFYTR